MIRFGRFLSACFLATLVATAAPAATHVVEVLDNSFSPENLDICLGDTVRWEWVGAVPHSTTSGDGCGAESEAWDSGTLTTGAAFEFLFDEIPPECAEDASAGADTCSYFCIPHCATMFGVITVTAGGGGSAALGIGVNKLRIAHDHTEGRGGTLKGAEVLSGAGFADILGDLTATVTLTGVLAGSGPFEISETVTLSSVRGNFAGKFAQDTGKALNIRVGKVTGTKDADTAKVTLKYETNGTDLSDLMPGTLDVQVDLTQELDAACGVVDVVGTFSGPVST